MSHHSRYDVAVIGAGISGITTAKCLLDDGFNIIVYEKTSHMGGLWQFTEDGYGVMGFTHMYVGSRSYIHLFQLTLSDKNRIRA